MAMSKYEAIIWEKEMKNQILSLARAASTDSYSGSSVFDVIHTGTNFRNGRARGLNTGPTQDTHLIVYKSPATNGGLEFVVTIEDVDTATGLEILKDYVQDQLGQGIEQAKELKDARADQPRYYTSCGDEVEDAQTAVDDALRFRMHDALGDLRTVVET